MKKTIVCTLIALTCQAPLLSDIQNVKVYWKRTICEDKCQETLYRYYDRVRGIEEVQIDPYRHEISMTWKENAPFSYNMVKTPLQMTGLGLNIIHVTVSGKIEMRAGNPILVSSGDQTLFYPVSPIRPRAPHEMVVRKNVLGRTLDPHQADVLIAAAEAGDTVTLSGPLFMPHRSPPLKIVIEKIAVSPRKEQERRPSRKR